MKAGYFNTCQRVDWMSDS